MNGSSITGTVFTSFSMTTSLTSIFQVDIADSSSPIPYLQLTVDGQVYSDFAQNYNYLKEFACKDNDTLMCATVTQSNTSAVFMFSNGLIVDIVLNVITIDSSQTESWLTCNMILTDPAYKNNTVGLMGNNNGDPSDDLVDRITGISANASDDKSVYRVASTCKFENLNL